MSKTMNKLQERINECLKSSVFLERDYERNILKTVLGEIQTIESRTGKLDDDGVIKIFKKFKQGVLDTKKIISCNGMEGYPSELDYEIDIYDKFIPKSISVEEIVDCLNPILDKIKASKSCGQATGIAIGHLKKEGLTVDGKDVSEAVNKIWEN